jgi:hypothetical protein
MSSVTRFLRQIPTGLTYVSPTALVAAALDFVPGTGNYVGNYPPGSMVLATSTGLGALLAANAAQANGQILVRDMGKTIFAPYAPTGSLGYFREYQLLNVSAIGAAQGFLGGVGGQNFGVIGPSAASVPGTSTYCTFYLPAVVGAVGSPSGLTLPLGVAGGQM